VLKEVNKNFVLRHVVRFTTEESDVTKKKVNRFYIVENGTVFRVIYMFENGKKEIAKKWPADLEQVFPKIVCGYNSKREKIIEKDKLRSKIVKSRKGIVLR
jgi:hypothetical protein